MKKIRILHIAQAAGGVDRYIQMLLKYLNKDTFENVLICSQDYREVDYKDLADSFEKVEMNREIGLNDISAIVQVRRLIKKYKPDIVYAHSSKAGAIARLAKMGLGTLCIYNPHGWAFNMNCSSTKKNLYALIEKAEAVFCDKIVCISEAEKRSALEKHICGEEKLKVIYNGVDIEAYEKGSHGEVKRSDLAIPEDATVVGMVGRISPQKAPDVFVKMAKLVREKRSDAHFIIVGAGEQKEEIMEYARDNGMEEHLHITGWVKNPMSYIELFDVACLLSRWEGFGLVLPEYMMAGKPIVATNVDAIPNIIQTGENGILVDCNDPKGASEAVIKLCDDVTLRSKIVKKATECVHERFDAKRVALEHEQLISQMRSQKRSNREIGK